MTLGGTIGDTYRGANSPAGKHHFKIADNRRQYKGSALNWSGGPRK